jgi:PAS domain S-box-containing protein
LTGSAPDELAGRPVSSVFLPEESDRVASFLEQLEHEESGTVDEFHIRAHTGQNIPVEISAGITATDAGRVMQMLVRDISRRL